MADDAVDDDFFMDGSDLEYDDSSESYENMDIMSESGFADQGLSVMSERLKPYQIEFQKATIGDIRNAQKKEIDHVANMFMIPTDDAAILLRHFCWNKERLVEQYMDSPGQVLGAAGVATGEQVLQTRSDFECSVCTLSADDFGGQMDTVTLQCGHTFCADCYRHYVSSKVINDGDGRSVRCMQEGCSMTLRQSTMVLLLDEKGQRRYQDLLDRAYVDDMSSLRWCPAPDCNQAVECHVTQKQLDTIIPAVQCGCGHWFCFGCGEEAHQPVICAIVKLWLVKAADDSETANWIGANTKECPKCRSTIEKNGGCNHMTCSKCRYEFCWICSGPWTEHGNSWYQCNRYDEKSSSEARDAQAKSRASLERYLHYFNRYANHEQSARLDRNLYSAIEVKMEQMQLTSDLTWIEVQFFKKAADTLTECRMTLKWTYAMAYYLARNNMTELFEDNQRDLEQAVESLSWYLGQPILKKTIPTMRQKVTDLTAYVQKRREILLTDTVQGYQEGRWRWNVEV
ncbi:RBR-type E3 ubiquitin transferase [Malassezia cuniculi]|uniref:RBR-type E3 ubiquitin transferase n=1 Tax=Malassezia cuniculi TaxID=948313 RepID=A0AAF0ERI8_9BASI|nr:RBR-type E3 ubiquitin transferase [Malassezia cuniculi]